MTARRPLGPVVRSWALSWPDCTVSGCRHRRTWPDPEAFRDAIEVHLVEWVHRNGHAVCECHQGTPEDNPPRFPCDESRDHD